MKKYILIIGLVLLFQSNLIAQSNSLDEYYKAYVETFSATEMGMNMPQDAVNGYEIIEKNDAAGYIKFKAKDFDLYIEMVLFLPNEDYLHFAVVNRYFQNDFRASIRSIKTYSLNLTPLGNPLEETSFMSLDQLYYSYYSKYATMMDFDSNESDDKTDVNYLRFVLPKKGENVILLQYATPDVDKNGMIQEEMITENGKDVIKTPNGFKTFGELRFDKKTPRLEFVEK